MSDRRADRRPVGWRTVNATATGLVAGLCARGGHPGPVRPAVAVAGAVVGLLAMLTGVILSWGVLTGRSARQDPSSLQHGSGSGRRVHPVAWFAPVVGSVVAVVAWAGVAHSSGSGWVQAVGALLAAVLITGLVAPLVPGPAVRRHLYRLPLGRRGRSAGGADPGGQRADPHPAPTPGGAGGPRRRCTPRVPDGRRDLHPGAAGGARRDRRRGGLVRSLRPALVGAGGRGRPAPAPARGAAVRRGRPAGDPPRELDGDAPLRVPSGAGEPRGVRPYQPGDTRRSVHWPATSHVGALMVREKERQTDDPIVVDLTLPADPVAAEAESERVMAALCQHLARGRPWCSAPSRPTATWCGWCVTGSTSDGAWPGPWPPALGGRRVRRVRRPAGRPVRPRREEGAGRRSRYDPVAAGRPGQQAGTTRALGALPGGLGGRGDRGRGRLLEPGRAEPGHGRVRHRGHGRRQRPVLLAAGATVAGGQAHPGRLRHGRLRAGSSPR